MDLQEKSVLDFGKAISLNPYESTYYSIYCELKGKSNKYSSEEILKDFKEWKEHCPDDKNIYWERATYYAAINRWKEAVSDMETAIVYTKNSLFYTKLADYKDRSGSYKPEDILQDLDKAAKAGTEQSKADYGYEEEAYKRLRAKYGKKD